MKVLVLGAKGNMGRRYCSILQYLKFNYIGLDIGDDPEEYMPDCDKIIIATPTESHLDFINLFSFYGKPILCEKPIAYNIADLEVLKEKLAVMKCELRMVDNYKYVAFDPIRMHSGSQYNYYNSGKDSKHWDCIQIHGIAVGDASISNESPIWKCVLNGYNVDRRSIDISYVKMIQNWYYNPVNNWEFIMRAHKRVLDAIERDKNA